MSATVPCPRCGLPATVTYSARGTERLHSHSCPHGQRCRMDGERVACPSCRAPGGPPAASEQARANAVFDEAIEEFNVRRPS